MPKRYRVAWSPKDNDGPESTATFTMVEDDPGDGCPDKPRKQKVKRAKRAAFEKGAKKKNQDRWTCAELKSELGVVLQPGNRT